jgi:diguanylate cyclase (GGDEF)-like protein/PAS domain S-box-containing protein
MEKVKDSEKTKEQLINELSEFLQQVIKLKKLEIKRKEAEKALRESEKKYRELVQNTNSIILRMDINGCITFFNEFAQIFFGYTEDEILGKNLVGTIVPEMDSSHRYLRAMIKDIIKNPERYAVNENENIRRNGERVWVLWTNKSVFDKDGHISEILCIGNDITERKHAEEALRESEKRFKQLAESAGEWIWEVDADGLYTYSSPVVEKILGFKSKEIIGKKHFFDLFAPDVREDLKKGAFEAFASKGSFKNFVNTNVHKNGSLVILETSGIPIIDDKGNFLGYRGADIDITERQRMLETTKKSEERFRDLFENANDAIWTADLKGKYMTINNLFEKLLGFKKEELIGKKSIYLVARESRKESIENYKKTLTGESAEYEAIVLNKKGERRVHWERIRPLREEGKIIGVQGIGRDITERKQNERLQQVLYNISKAANSPISLNQLYKTIHRELGIIIDTTNFYIALLDEKKDEIIFPYYIDEKDDDSSALKLRKYNIVSNTPTSYVIKTGQPLLLDYQKLNQMIAQGKFKPEGAITDKSIWLGVPLKIEDKAIGAMAVQSYTNPNLYSEGDIKFLEFVSSQVTTVIERKRTEERIKHLSFHDSLTGLYNRAYFEEELKRLNNSRYYPLSIISLDVNGLKVVNDTFGHDQGDKLLQHLASLLTSISRKGDIIARVGGDEFAILLPSTSSQATLDICERIRKVCLEDDIKPAYLRVNLALGYVTQEGEYKDIKTLLKEADRKMYQDKLFSTKSREKHLLDSFQLVLAERDPHTEDHSQRLQDLALALGKKVGLSEYQLNNLRLLALLHDIGKIGIPDSILFKTYILTPSEWKKMKEHPKIGYRMAKNPSSFPYHLHC